LLYPSKYKYSLQHSVYNTPLMWETRFHSHTKQAELSFCIFQSMVLDIRWDNKSVSIEWHKHSKNLICSISLQMLF
jgi:hypothetical protein